MCPGFKDLDETFDDWFGPQDSQQQVESDDWFGPLDDQQQVGTDIGGDFAVAPPIPDSSPAGQSIADGRQEPSFLEDPMGAIDRQIARAQIASRFEIVDDDYEGPRTPNQVGAEEYEQIARTISDIRLGRSDIQIDVGPRATNFTDEQKEGFRGKMLDDIADVMQTRNGRELIAQLHNNQQADEYGNIDHRTTHLQAMADNSGFKTTATAGETIIQDGEFEDRPDMRAGDALVLLNPNEDVSDSPTVRVRSDVALFHELSHAYHDTHGLTPSDRMEAENLATGLGEHADYNMSENAYRRERNAVAFSGRGLPGDLMMEERRSYDDDVDMYDPYDGTTEIEPD